MCQLCNRVGRELTGPCHALQIKLVNIRAEDIVDGNPKLTLGLVWTIILHFQVSPSDEEEAGSVYEVIALVWYVVEPIAEAIQHYSCNEAILCQLLKFYDIGLAEIFKST